MKKGKTRIGKVFTLCKKGSAEKIMGWDLSKKCPKSDPKRGKTRKNGLHRAKNERYLSKNRPKSGSKRRKAGKAEILE